MTFRLWGMDVCAYGHLSWITPCLTFLAMLFFMLAAFRCSLTVQTFDGGAVKVWSGYWKIERFDLASALGAEDDSNVCVKYANSDGFDGVWKFGKSLGVIGVFTTVPTALFNILLITNRFQLSWFNTIICIHIVNCIMTLLLILSRASDYCKQRNCVLARAGYVAIIGSIFWLIAAYLHHLMKKIEMELTVAINGVESKDDEPRLALPAPGDDYGEYDEAPPQQELLALPAPGDDEAPPEEELLALPAPGDDEEASLPRKVQPSKKSKKRAANKKKKPLSSSSREVDNDADAGLKKRTGTKKKKTMKKTDDMA